MIKTALLSFGMSGQVFHAPFLELNPEFTLLGACERSKKQIQKKYAGVKSYDSIEEVLADDEVQLVVVNTPTYTHYEFAKRALLAGKHVIVEKAFTTTVAEAEELDKLAQENSLKLFVFQNRRWDSDFKTVQKIINEGYLGEIVEASIAFARYRPELSPKRHKEAEGPGAGIIKDLGAHVIDQALCLFGMPDEVFADIGITREGSEVDDYFDILLRYTSGLRVHVRGGYFFKEPVADFSIHGRNGSFLKSRADVQEDQLKAGILPNDPQYGLEPETEKGILHAEINGSFQRKSVATEVGCYMDFYNGVSASIQSNEPEPVSASDGIRVMKIIDAAFKSHKHSRVVKLL